MNENDTVLDRIKGVANEPVRAFAVLSAALVLAALYVPEIPVAAILAVVAAVLGVGEGVRHFTDGPQTAQAKNEEIARWREEHALDLGG